MKTLNYFFLLVLATACLSLRSEIIETKCMREVASYVTPKTWIILDVDNTTIESAIQLGTAQWRTHFRQNCRKAGLSKEKTEETLELAWRFVQSLCPVQLVDSETPAILSQLSQKNVQVLFLTARDPLEKETTIRQLESVGISLDGDLLFPKDSFYFANNSLYDHQVIYCGDTKKEHAFPHFFK